MSAKVLLVDDERDFTTVLSERLETRGVQVDVADNGQEAVECVDKTVYDAIVLDLAMPGMDGIETMKQLLAKNPDLQVILLTGHGSVQKSVEALKEGAVEFLEKPAKIDVLLEKINEAQTQRVFLVEKRLEDTMSDILRKKGW